jgi:hypothetical protein
MSVIKELHNKSMEFAELAFMARVRGDLDDSINLFSQALEYELAAIAELEKTERIEPTYSVLHRSAGTLAIDCNESRRAEQIVTRALSQDPPPEIAEELRDLLEQINFRRHLELRGVILEEDEMQMNLAGRGVGFGVVNSDEFITRVNNSSNLFYRIVERRRNKPFRERGRLKKSIKEDYELFVSVPRAASFSVTLKLGRPTDQPSLPGMLDTSAVVDEFMDLMDLVNRSKLPEIQERIPDPAYFRNFLALAKKMAPDGETVRQVGFTSIRGGSERFVEVTKPAKDFPRPNIEELHVESEWVVVKGVLRFADATHGDSGLIKVIDEDRGSKHTIKVPEGMMSDIVRPMWDSVVTIKGKREGRLIILEDIQEE